MSRECGAGRGRCGTVTTDLRVTTAVGGSSLHTKRTVTTPYANCHSDPPLACTLRLIKCRMRLSSRYPHLTSDITWRKVVFMTAIVVAATALGARPSGAQAQASSNPLVSREELVAAATQAETAAKGSNADSRARTSIVAASIRQRLRDGDFQVGDRVVVVLASDIVHRDTLVVRAGRVLELPGKIAVPLTGVLRSELQDRVASEVLKYVKARQIEVTPLMRVAVLGEVAHPGYFAFASDLPLTDAIMGAGGPSAVADFGRSIVRRGNTEFRSSAETHRAIADGLTLDQFGLSAGDEVVIGRRREFSSTLLTMIGAAASLTVIFVAFHRR